jgi:hypothetical protein
MGWHRSVPFGCRKMLNYLWDKYKTPIYMTENVSRLQDAEVPRGLCSSEDQGMPVKGESDMPKDKAYVPNMTVGI